MIRVKMPWTLLLLAGLVVSSDAFADKGDRIYGGVSYGPRTIANGMVRPAAGKGDRIYGGVSYGPRTIASGAVRPAAARWLRPVWVGTRHVRALDGRGPVDRPGVTFKKPHNTMAVTQVASKMFGGERPDRRVVRKAMAKLFRRSGLTSSQIDALAAGKLQVYGARLITDPRARTIPGAGSNKGHAVFGAVINATAVTPWDTNGASKRYVNLVLKSSRPDERALIQRLAHDAEAQAAATGR